MAQNTLAAPARGRDRSLDIIRGLDILLVVYAHTLPFCRDFIHVIAIPLFLLVSGYCWHPKISTWGDFGRFFLKRLKSLYVPFVLYNWLFTLLGGLFLKIGFYTNDTALFDIARDWPIPQTLYGTPGVQDYVRSLLRILIMQETTKFGTATWFLIILLAINVTQALFDLLSSRLKLNGKLWIPLADLVLMAVLSQIYFVHNQNQAYLKTFFCCYFSFLIGIFLQRIRWKYFTSWWMGILAFGGVLLVSHFYHYELSAAVISEVPVYLFSCTCAWVLAKSLAQGITHVRWLSDGLGWIGRHTIPVMCLHVLCFKFAALLYIKVYSLPRVYLAGWHTILDTSDLWKVFFTVVGAGGSILIAMVWYQLRGSFRRLKGA